MSRRANWTLYWFGDGCSHREMGMEVETPAEQFSLPWFVSLKVLLPASPRKNCFAHRSQKLKTRLQSRHTNQLFIAWAVPGGSALRSLQEQTLFYVEHRRFCRKAFKLIIPCIQWRIFPSSVFCLICFHVNSHNHGRFTWQGQQKEQHSQLLGVFFVFRTNCSLTKLPFIAF